MKLSRTISVSAGILAASSVASYAFGLLRDRLLASQFGASAELDVFNASFLVPDAIMTLFGAALTTAFIPVFSNWWHEQGETATWQLVNTVLRIIGIGIIITIIVAWLAMPWLTLLLAPGFTGDQHALLTSTTRVMLLSPLFFSISVLFGSALQGLRRFISYAVSPVLYNLGIVFGILVLSKPFGIHGVIYGVVIGAALHMLIRLIELRYSGWTFSVGTSSTHRITQHPGLRETVRLMIPRMLALLIWQGNLWFYTAMASHLFIGSIAIFNLARNFQSLPVSLFGIALATAVFPALASTYVQKKADAFAHDISKAIRQLLFFTLPAAVGMMVLAEPLVTTFLGSGKFTGSAIIATSVTLAVFSMSIPLESLQHMLSRAFFAQHDARTPLYITMAASVANVIVSLLAMQWFYVSGLAFGFVAYSAVQVILLLVYLRKKLTTIDGPAMLLSLTKMLFASGIMGCSVLLVTIYVQNPLQAFFTGVITGGIVYSIVAALLRLPELTTAVLLIKRLIKRA